MPEGDTIHYAANRIRPLLEGNVPEEILTPQPRHALDRWPERLRGRAVLTVRAHGKHLFLRFEGDLTLHSHLRMSGAWGIYDRAERWRRSPGRAWLILRAGGGEVVQFDGPVLELMSDSRTRFDQRLAALGPDILGDDFDVPGFLRRLRMNDEARPIGEVLLDQRTLAGIGNVWKSEACFGALVDPWRPVGDLDDSHALSIVDFARKQMGRCAHEGTRARPQAVYRRAGLACERCGTPIKVCGMGEQNRMTFWCPGCQR